jgi:histidinol-phosphate aminotransferase
MAVYRSQCYEFCLLSSEFYILSSNMTYFRENIENMQAYQPGFQPPWQDVVKLNTNENPYPASPQVLNVLSQINPEMLRRYPDPLGNQFRFAASELHGVAPDCIMCCNGGDELLKMAFEAFCDENRPVAYPVPTYTLYRVLANIQNCKAIEIPFDKEYNLPAKLSGTNAALTIVCNPNAPSGSIISPDELASLADEISGVLLIDEAYVDFANDNCVELAKNFDNVIILRTLSKSYSLAGLRFGYAIAQPEMINGLLKVKDSYNTDAIAISVATAAIKDQDHFEQNVQRIRIERVRLTGQLRDLGFEVPESHSNFVLAEYKKGSAKPIYEELVKRNVYVRYFENPGIENKLRISIGTPPQDEELIKALKEILVEKK